MTYATAMSSADEAIAPLADQDVGPLSSDFSPVHWPAARDRRELSSQNTWDIRRAIVRVRSALVNMRLEDASKATRRLKRLLSDRDESALFRYAHTVRILEASILAAADDFPAARSLLLGVGAHGGNTSAATVLRYVDWRHGNQKEGYAPDAMDYLASPVGGKAVWRILNLCVSAAFAFDRVQLAVSAHLATEALHLARTRYGNHSPLSTLPATLLAQAAYEQGRLEEAEALVRARLSVIRTSGTLDCVARASVLLARISLHRGRHREALSILREAATLGRIRRWPRLVSIASSEHARTIEVLRDQDGQGLRGPERPGAAALVQLQRTRRGAIIANRRYPPSPPRTTPDSSQLITPTASDTFTPDNPLRFSDVETALQKACSVAAFGSINESYKVLMPWLRIGATRGLHMTFVDAGRPLLALLEGLYHAVPTDDPRLSDLRPFIAALLRSKVQSRSEDSSPIAHRPLSRRETGILQMIAAGLSNKRIALSLGITPETVKSHAKSIFVKLATRTRAQAVSRAEAIGLL